MVVTWRRTGWLERCVRSLAAAAAAEPRVSLEIRVAVNGTDPATLSRLESLRAEIPALGEPEAYEPALTPAAARNRALLSTRGDWVVFIDDDAYVASGYFGAFLAALERQKDASLVGGPNLTPPGSPLIARATGAVLSSRLATFLSVSRYRVRGDTRRCGEESLILCNLFARRSSLPAGAFPEDFVCGEENWMMQTLQAAGAKLVHAPALAVFHERRDSVARLARQIFAYGEGRGRNIRRRPATLRLAHIIPSLCVAYALAAAVGWGCQGWMGAQRPWLWVPFVLYAALVLLATLLAWRRAGESPGAAALMPFFFVLVHVVYGVGVLAGLSRA